MKRLSLLVIVAVSFLFCRCNQSEIKAELNSKRISENMKKIEFIYPKTRKDSTEDEYFGVLVKDPYRWLENDTSAEVAQWIKEQNEVTFGYLNEIPFRDKIRDRLTELWNFAKYSAPFIEGSHYYYYSNDGLQNQSVLYVMDSLNGEARVFIDPNKLSDDGTIALAGLGFSTDGLYCAYSIAKGGSDWNEIYVKETATGKLLDDHLVWVKFSSISWFKNGFYYSRYDATDDGKEFSNKNTYHKVYYHTLGTPQKKDIIIYEDKNDPLRSFIAQVSDDEKILAIYEMKASHGNSLLIRKNGNDPANRDFVKLADGFDIEYSIIDHIDGYLIIKTNDNAPRYKLMKVDLNNINNTANKDSWTTIIPEKQDVLESVSLLGGKMVVTYMHDAHSLVEVYDYNGNKEYDIDLPSIGSCEGFSGKKENDVVFYTFSSFTIPSTVYKYNLKSRETSVYFKPEIDFNPDDYEVKQIFYGSKDGTKIPMFIFHKKGMVMNGDNPTLLYGYGGFNISMTPSFSIRRTVWLETGGVVAVACLRGGGEYGEEWHEAGTKLKKQNVFDDFISAAEYLIRERYTSPAKLAIRGGSNGGLLVGACANQRPDLFRVALPAVGVMDMLRFHKFTIGWNWTGDYGSSDDQEQFKNIYKFSPLHNIREGVEYPAILVTTADHDDRVVPAHSFKYIAELQDKYKGPSPVMIRIDVMAGHGAGKPTSKTIEENADIWAFTFFNMGITPELPEKKVEGKNKE